MGIFRDAYAMVSGGNTETPTTDARTVASRSGLITGARGRNRVQAERVPVPTDEIRKYWHMYKTVPFIRAAFNQARDDILADGYRIEADNSETQRFLNEWAESAGTIGAERNQDLHTILRALPIQLLARGTVLLEHNPAEADGEKTAGVSYINPATVTPYRASDTNLLLRPDDTQYEGAKLTEDGKAAAYVQFDSGPNATGDDERRLTLDDVTRLTIDADTHDVFGTSRVAPVAERIEALLSKLQNNDRAIESMAWGQWFVGFGHETVKNEDGSETIIEWEDDDMGEFMGDLEAVEPGDIEGHDGTINIENLPGEVADIIDQLQYETHYILTAMPAPTYAIGFESDINQFVVDGQEERHEQRINHFQGTIERALTPIPKMVARENDLSADGVRLKLEPPAPDSPVLNLSDSEIERIAKYSSAFKELSGGEPRTLVPDDVIREKILQMEGVDAPEQGPGEDGLSIEDLEDMNPEDMLQQAANE